MSESSFSLAGGHKGASGGASPTYLLIVAAAAVTSGAAVGLWNGHSNRDPLAYFAYLGLALLVARMKLRLPLGIACPPYFLFILLGILELSLLQTVIIACSACLLAD